MDQSASEIGRALVGIRWKKTTKAQRSEIARGLARSRWDKVRAKRKAKKPAKSDGGSQ